MYISHVTLSGNITASFMIQLEVIRFQLISMFSEGLLSPPSTPPTNIRGGYPAISGHT